MSFSIVLAAFGWDSEFTAAKEDEEGYAKFHPHRDA
jgi:hypothetical protein